MPTLQHLPVELHELILQYHVVMMTGYLIEDGDVESSSDNEMDAEEDAEDDSDVDEDSNVERFAWPPPEIYSQTFFPYNVASTCTLWYNILIKIPECWTKVVFDLTESPAGFLDIFLWSKDLMIDTVVVYSSHFLNPPSSHDEPPDWLSREGRDLEYSRVRDIMRVLRPHIHRCLSIAFMVAFDYCVPSPVEFVVARDRPQLRVLSLRSCYTSDPSCWAPLVDMPPVFLPGANPSLFPPTLTLVVIEGGWFSNLARNHHTWPLFRMQLVHPQHRLKYLIVYNFEFGRAVNTIPVFIAALCNLNVGNLWLGYLGRLPPESDDDMSVYMWPTKRPSLLCLRASKIVFDYGVSKRFLEELNAVACINATQELKFLFCEIPFISHPYFAPFLTLTGVRNVSSLKNALCSWKGHRLLLEDCAFDDEFLTWLQLPMVDMRVPAHNLTYLAIRDCTNFTAAGLIGFIDSRFRTGLDSRIHSPNNWTFYPFKIIQLELSGRRPVLTRGQDEYLSLRVN